MGIKRADHFFNDVNFVSIVDNVKGIFTSDGTMSTLLDFERVLDEADLYAYKNWIVGELVDGPNVGRYSVKCTFMWPKNLMPDPRGAKRLLAIGCKLVFAKSKIKVPIEIKDYEDFVPGTRYPKGVSKPVWFVSIEIPLQLMDEIKEGSIDLADQKIDLDEIEDAYSEDLEKEGSKEETKDENQQMGSEQPIGAMPLTAPTPGV